MNLSEAIVDITAAFRDRYFWTALGWQDIRTRYRRSALGPLWITISTAVTVAAMGPLYGALFARSPAEFIPHLALGLIFWAFIAGSINEFCDAFSGSAHYLKQVKLPLTVFVLRVIYRQFIILCHNVFIYPVVMVLLGKSINANLLLLFPGLLLVSLNLLWIGLVVAIFCTRYRDMHPVVNSVMSLMFFITPIVWQVDQLPADRAHLAHLNPLTILLELMRQPILGIAPPLMYWVVALVAVVAGSFFTIGLLARFRHRVTYWL
ncbi:ABC transporter permease [Pigmentiphaga sp. NML080357]|uniref:ABC transporter permease n=1 Tax=Pigmentiphaga sp. NML080357 TaxID=2008675 RepID=UPI001E59BCE1|nr:ABC transporter permease [Pigmentiphaga sp. NML080357]